MTPKQDRNAPSDPGEEGTGSSSQARKGDQPWSKEELESLVTAVQIYPLSSGLDATRPATN